MGSDVDISGGMDVDLGGTIGLGGSIGINGIPSHFDIDIGKLPKISIGVDPLTATMTLTPVTINPVSLNIAITDLPEQRMHLPADFTVGLSMLGLQLLCVRLCGEAQMINEPYVPNPCEHCGPDRGGRVNVGDLDIAPA
jgi:hypothetical protein